MALFLHSIMALYKQGNESLLLSNFDKKDSLYLSFALSTFLNGQISFELELDQIDKKKKD